MKRELRWRRSGDEDGMKMKWRWNEDEMKMKWWWNDDEIK